MVGERQVVGAAALAEGKLVEEFADGPAGEGLAELAGRVVAVAATKSSSSTSKSAPAAMSRCTVAPGE